MYAAHQIMQGITF